MRSVARVVVVAAAVYAGAALVNTETSTGLGLALACLLSAGALADRWWLLLVPVLIALTWAAIEIAGGVDPDDVNPLPRGFPAALLAGYGLIASATLAAGIGFGRLAQAVTR